MLLALGAISGGDGGDRRSSVVTSRTARGRQVGGRGGEVEALDVEDLGIFERQGRGRRQRRRWRRIGGGARTVGRERK